MKSSFALPTRRTPERPRLSLPPRRWANMVLAACAAVLLGNGAPAPDLIDAVQARYDRINDIRAEFTQTARIASIGKSESSSGQVVIRRPGQMRWEYTEPETRVIALDGSAIRMYLPEDRQLQIAALDAANFPPTALDFLLGSGDLRKSFSATELPTKAAGERGLRLQPKQDASFEYLEIWVSSEDFQLRESIVVDLFGNRTSVRFASMRENQGVQPETFEIEVPSGTDVIDLREGR